MRDEEGEATRKPWHVRAMKQARKSSSTDEGERRQGMVMVLCIFQVRQKRLAEREKQESGLCVGRNEECEEKSEGRGGVVAAALAVLGKQDKEGDAYL